MLAQPGEAADVEADVGGAGGKAGQFNSHQDAIGTIRTRLEIGHPNPEILRNSAQNFSQDVDSQEGFGSRTASIRFGIPAIQPIKPTIQHKVLNP